MSSITTDEDFGPDGYITTLHPEGSFNNVQFGGRVLVRPDIDYVKAVVNVLVPVTIRLQFAWRILA